MKKIFFLLISILVCSSCNNYSDYEKQYLDSSSKKPFGTYIFEKELPQLFPNNKIKIITNNFIDDVLLNPDKSQSKNGNYLVVIDDFSMNRESTDELLQFISEGNVAFIAANYFSPEEYDDGGISNTLEFFISSSNTDTNDLNLHLSARNFSTVSYPYKRYLSLNYISSYNPETTSVLGYYTDKSGETNPNFIRIKYGDGFIYIHTQPQVFSNHYLLQSKEHAQYIARCLSYLKDGDLFFDGYKTQTRKLSKEYEKIDSDNDSGTDFGFLNDFLEYTSFKNALYTALIGVFALLLLRSKRRQRIIPIINPLKNTSVAFSKTITNLYSSYNSNAENAEIAHKILLYFFERIRTEIRMPIHGAIDDNFINNLQQKTQIEHTQVKELFTFINYIQIQITENSVTNEELHKLDKLTYEFYKKTKII